MQLLKTRKVVLTTPLYKVSHQGCREILGLIKVALNAMNILNYPLVPLNWL